MDRQNSFLSSLLSPSLYVTAVSLLGAVLLVEEGGRGRPVLLCAGRGDAVLLAEGWRGSCRSWGGILKRSFVCLRDIVNFVATLDHEGLAEVLDVVGVLHLVIGQGGVLVNDSPAALLIERNDQPDR